LSTAAQAGIGVGISICAILLGVIAYFLWKLNRKKKGDDVPQDQGEIDEKMPPTSLDRGPDMFGYPVELMGEPRLPVELNGVPNLQPAELQGGTTHPIEK
jgi:hypothetical protein